MEAQEDVSPEVSSLVGSEGGLWIVETRDSVHLFDLDEGTVERVPGPHAGATVNDVPRPIRTIDRCEVGASGRWTMHSDNDLIDYYWAHTSAIARIRRSEASK